LPARRSTNFAKGIKNLARILKYRANRWTNMIAGFIMTVVQTFTMFAGKPAPYYIFCAIIEILATAYIVWYAWKWIEAREKTVK
jgi:hypothetical protein